MIFLCMAPGRGNGGTRFIDILYLRTARVHILCCLVRAYFVYDFVLC